MIKSAIKMLIGKLGYEIQIKQNTQNSSKPASEYECCMYALMCDVQKINIVQVGANDGVINDPIFDFVNKNSSRINLTLIEPQSYIIPILENNYSFHDEKLIFNGAIGPAGQLTLYAVDPSYWGKLDVPYAVDWPPHRAPSGITSVDRDRVSAWLMRHLRKGEVVEEAIKEFSVPSLGLVDLLTSMGQPAQIDVLQVDAEGFDDEVIYNSSIDVTKPRLINFESKHISSDRLNNIIEHLKDHGYEIIKIKKDILAIKTSP